MPYAELSYFDGYAFAHIVSYLEAQRLAGIRRRAAAHFQRLPIADRRRGGRIAFRK